MFWRDQSIGSARFIAPPWCLVRLQLAMRFGVLPPAIDDLGVDEVGRILELLSLEQKHGRRPDGG